MTPRYLGNPVNPVRVWAAIVAAVVAAAVFSPPASATGAWSAPVAIDTHAGQNTLTSVSCPSNTFCVAVDNGANNSDGHALTFDGKHWGAPQVIDSVGSYGPVAVSCPSTSFCTAVDGSGDAIAFDGGAWGVPTPVAGGSLDAVSCASSNFCMALEGDAFAYNGSSWSPPADGCVNATSACGLGSSNGEIFLSVSCPSATFCAAVGHNGGAATYDGGGFSGGSYDGTGWTYDGQIDSTGAVQSLNAVSCASSTFCVAVDGNGNAFTYNGSSWGGPVSIDPGGGGLSSVSCVSPSFCVAVDGAGRALVFDGSTWSATTVDSAGQGLTAVSCASTAFCVALDTRGDALTYTATSGVPPTKKVRACRTPSLRLSVVRQLGAAGHRSLDLELRNAGSVACTLRGYPAARLLLRSGRPLRVGVAHAHGFPVDTVKLAPRGDAFFTLIYAAAGPSLPRHFFTVYGLRVTPPGNPKGISLRVPGFTVAGVSSGGSPRVTPVRARLGGL